jgi:hypothetical protein
MWKMTAIGFFARSELQKKRKREKERRRERKKKERNKEKKKERKGERKAKRLSNLQYFFELQDFRISLNTLSSEDEGTMDGSLFY